MYIVSFSHVILRDVIYKIGHALIKEKYYLFDNDSFSSIVFFRTDRYRQNNWLKCTAKIVDYKLHGLDKSTLDTALSLHDYYTEEETERHGEGRNSDKEERWAKGGEKRGHSIEDCQFSSDVSSFWIETNGKLPYQLICKSRRNCNNRSGYMPKDHLII